MEWHFRETNFDLPRPSLSSLLCLLSQASAFKRKLNIIIYRIRMIAIIADIIHLQQFLVSLILIPLLLYFLLAGFRKEQNLIESATTRATKKRLKSATKRNVGIQ